jgi:hypothetical protein
VNGGEEIRQCSTVGGKLSLGHGGDILANPTDVDELNTK